MLAAVAACAAVTISAALTRSGEAAKEKERNARRASMGARGVGSDNVVVLESRAIRALFTRIRDERTGRREFAECSDRLLRILAEEALVFVSTVEEVTVRTPCGPYSGLKLRPDSDLCLVTVMRSGNILQEAVRIIAPNATCAHVLIQRDEHSVGKEPKKYYSKFPPGVATKQVLVVDPMLATGGSASMTIDEILAEGVPEENISFICLVAAPEGLARLTTSYPRLRILVAAVDSHLNSDCYIVPGLGDFGDRYCALQLDGASERLDGAAVVRALRRCFVPRPLTPPFSPPPPPLPPYRRHGRGVELVPLPRGSSCRERPLTHNVIPVPFTKEMSSSITHCVLVCTRVYVGKDERTSRGRKREGG